MEVGNVISKLEEDDKRADESTRSNDISEVDSDNQDKDIQVLEFEENNSFDKKDDNSDNYRKENIIHNIESISTNKCPEEPKDILKN